MTLKHATLALLTAALLAGCGSSTKTYYYTLQTGAVSEATAKPNRNSIAITSLSLPEIVDRPQLVLRAGDTQVLVSDNHLWGQPLKSEITRNLATHLARETGVARVILPSQSGYDEADFKIAIDILRFDATPGSDATIEASWNLRRKGATQAQNGQTVIREAVSGPGYDALVAAHGRALARLGRDIAATLKP